jgi:asparagine synthetase B (glutamine-hydrolysing)
MCGILGCWTSRSLNKELLRATLSSMHHSGPDDCGVVVDTRGSIGITRLSIIEREIGQATDLE